MAVGAGRNPWGLPASLVLNGSAAVGAVPALRPISTEAFVILRGCMVAKRLLFPWGCGTMSMRKSKVPQWQVQANRYLTYTPEF